jgi:hypothetical protein
MSSFRLIADKSTPCRRPSPTGTRAYGDEH